MPVRVPPPEVAAVVEVEVKAVLAVAAVVAVVLAVAAAAATATVGPSPMVQRLPSSSVAAVVVGLTVLHLMVPVGRAEVA